MRHASPRAHGHTRQSPAQSHVPVAANHHVQNLDIRGVAVHRKSDVVPRSDPADIAALLAIFGPSIKLMGDGVYAQVYRIESTPEARRALEHLQSLVTNAVAGARVKNGPVILKVGLPTKREDWAAFLKRSVRENAAHLAVQTVDASIVPSLYFAGSIGQIYVAAMEVASGVTLADFIEQHGGIPRKVYANLQRAVITSLSAGIVHGDLHDYNVMVAPDGSVKIIDFGFAVQLSPEQRKAVQSLVHTNTNAAWNAIGEYVNAVQAQRIRGLTWYNPEVKALRVWRSMITNAPVHGTLHGGGAAHGTLTPPVRNRARRARHLAKREMLRRRLHHVT